MVKKQKHRRTPSRRKPTHSERQASRQALNELRHSQHAQQPRTGMGVDLSLAIIRAARTRMTPEVRAEWDQLQALSPVDGTEESIRLEELDNKYYGMLSREEIERELSEIECEKAIIADALATENLEQLSVVATEAMRKHMSDAVREEFDKLCEAIEQQQCKNTPERKRHRELVRFYMPKAHTKVARELG